MKILLLLLLLQDKEADEAIKVLKTALATSGDDGQIEAIKEALKVRHEKVIKAVLDPLTSGSDKVRIGAALALGEVDHPASVDVLLAGLRAAGKKSGVLAAVARALGMLGYEASAGPLGDLVKNAGDADVRAALPEVFEAIGSIGSVGSVDPLVDFLRRVKGPRRDPWPNTNELISGAEKALKAITGGDGGKINEFEDWWKDNKKTLLSGAKRTYWLKKTGERAEILAGEKAPADSVLVGSRLVDKVVPKKKKK